MEPIKIADGVTEIIEFLEPGASTINEKIAMLRSAADLFSQVLIAEATAASMVATFKNIYEKKE